jgi:hypothetical protein
MQTNTPIQRQDSLWVKAMRRLLKLQIVKHIAFNLGLKGFDRVQVQIGRFLGYDKNGRKVYRYETPQVQYNARVNVGAALQASVMSGATLGGLSAPAAPKYIALSPTSLTPAAGDTTLSGETATAGVARALGTIQNYVAPASLDGAASYDIYKLFTLTGAGLTINSSALFDAASVGNMFAEANLASAAILATSDTIAITWTVNI